MPSHYEQLAISPYASSQEIETALAQQHQLGDIPAPVLALIATTLLSEQQRQAYDQQLMALDELSHTPNSTEGSLDTNTSHYSAAAAAVPPPSETTNNDGIVFYDGMHSLHHSNQVQKSSWSRFDGDLIGNAIGDELVSGLIGVIFSSLD